MEKVKEYLYKDYKVKINYLNEKSLNDYLNESIDTSLIPKIMEEISDRK